jgi:ubiquitin C-terminal hydrolase
MSSEYYIVVKNLWDKKNNKKSYAPHSFKNLLSKENPLFEGVNANDSKDLINFLLERFHQELNSIDAESIQNNNIIINQQDQLDEQKMLNLFLFEFKKKYRSIISDLFYGVMETKSQCKGCNCMKYNFQVYSFIEFPLEQVNNYYIVNGLKVNNNNTNPDVNLLECFNYYCKVDLMNGDNQMYCNICKINCDALYSTSLYSLPNNLIINLNRGKNAIYNCKVNFPEKLNLLDFVTFQEGNTYFELYAVISHLGPSSMSGHFIAYCKHKKDKMWYKYNDSIVERCAQKDEFRSGMPYILFYQAL